MTRTRASALVGLLALRHERPSHSLVTPRERDDRVRARRRWLARRLCATAAVAASLTVAVTGSAGASQARSPVVRFDQATAMPAVGNGSGGLGGLSCPSPRLCVTVGATASGRAGWAWGTENRGSWTWSSFRDLQPLSIAPDLLTSVSCPTPTRCAAVGYAMDGHAQHPWDSGYAIAASGVRLAGSWRWSVPTVVPPGNTGIDRLTSVSCPTKRQCVAVGLNVSQEGIAATASWDGSGWTWSGATRVPPDATGLGELRAVSCPTPTTCVAVGDDDAAFAAATPGGTGVTTTGTKVGAVWTWSPETTVTSDLTGATRLTSVSCPVPTRCAAVGEDAARTGVEVAGTMTTGGWSWTAATPLATTSDGRYALAFVTSVSCVPALCVLVGANANGDGVYAVARGPLPAASWSRVFDPSPGSLRKPSPAAVSCPLADDCVQVGVTADKTNYSTATMAAPTFARDVRAVPGNGRAVVAWASPLFDGGAMIRSYRVTAEPGGRTCAIVVHATTRNTCIVIGLANGRRYRFVVTASNGSGSSPSSRPSRTIIPSPFQPPVSSPFTRGVHDFVASQRDVVSASVYDVLTGQSWTINPTSVQHTASIVKVEILGALLFDEQRNHAQMPSSTRALATSMIEDSNNNSATALFNQIGQAPGLAAFGHLVGLTGTTPSWAWGFTNTTALDQTRIVRLFVLPNHVLDTASRQFGLGLMHHVTPYQSWGISSGPPPGVPVAIKNGWYPTAPGDWQINSVGWVNGDRRNYVIAVITNTNASMGDGVATIESLSRLLWQNLGRRPAPRDR